MLNENFFKINPILLICFTLLSQLFTVFSQRPSANVSFIFLKVILLNYFHLFIGRCWVLLAAFLWLQWAGSTPHCGAEAEGPRGPSICSSRALEHRLSWRLGLVALRHVGSSWTRDQTHVPCIARQILNHWPPPRNFSSYFFLTEYAWYH